MTTTAEILDPLESSVSQQELLGSGEDANELFLEPPHDAENSSRTPKFIGKVFRGLRRLIPGWLGRRGWLLAIAVIAGGVGGFFYGNSAHPTYAAQVLLSVPSGASSEGPGNANDASALALDYAAVLGNENDILGPAAQELGISLTELKDRISVSVETGTDVLVLRYKAPTEDAAIAGVNAVAVIVGQVNRASSIIPSKTLDVVELATSASNDGTLSKYGAELGVVLGLLVGGLLVLIAERMDPRADTSEDISEVFHHPTVAVPGELSALEFAHAVSTAAAPGSTFTLAPLRTRDLSEAGTFQRVVHADAPNGVPTWTVSDMIEERSAHRLNGGAVVLVVRSGERMRAIGDALERLRLMGMSLVWVLLLDRHDPIS
jgi:capsular polysaccharide biosynthesis protein